MALQNKAIYYDGEPREDISYNEKIEVFEKLHREWGPHLSVSEAKIVGWLLANTIVRGKRSGTYSYRQFVEGVPNHRDGGMWTEGTGMPIATVRRAVASCQKKGVIHKVWDVRGGKYTVQTWWDPVSGNAEDASIVSLERSRATRSR